MSPTISCTHTCIRPAESGVTYAMRPDGKVLFVSLWFSDAVAAIDVQTRKVVSNMQFELGGGPKRIAIAKRVR